MDRRKRRDCSRRLYRKNSVIGAGSVVTKDIPENVVAVGNPCRVLREIGPRDREYFYKTERIDWENLDRPGEEEK